jgi:hypothetical protein
MFVIRASEGLRRRNLLMLRRAASQGRSVDDPSAALKLARSGDWAVRLPPPGRRLASRDIIAQWLRTGDALPAFSPAGRPWHPCARPAKVHAARNRRYAVLAYFANDPPQSGIGAQAGRCATAAGQSERANQIAADARPVWR